MPKHYLSKFTLLQALIIMIVVSLLLPLPVFLAIYANSTYETNQEKAIILNTKKFELSSEIFTESLWNYYPELGQTMLEELSLDENIISISVKDAYGKEFLAWKNLSIKKIPEVSTFVKSLKRNEKEIGTLTIKFKNETLISSVQHELLRMVIVAILQAIFIISVISYVYYFKIIKPVRQLVDDSKKLSQRKLDEPFEWSGKDEINSLGIALDNTRVSLKSLFEKMSQQNETLDEKVQQRTSELEEANRYKSEFLANMSHEIRTPMNAIVGMCHLISKTTLNKDQSNYITKIKDASSVLLHIINDILDFSKIEAGKIELENIAFDLHKELDKSASIFSILAKEKGIEFDAKFNKTHRFFRGDPYKIIQIINNFLSNAIKFTSKGGVYLTLREERLDNGLHRMVFAVKDNGTGIKKEKKEKLFKAFGQLDASTTRKHGGTGLGLYISAQLAHMMDGKIRVESEYGQGSEFSLELDLLPVDGALLQKEASSDSFTPLNVLMIEDDKDSIVILEGIIRSFGYFITTVRDYEEAYESISKNSYDILIIDYHLPKFNGVETYKRLKKSFSDKELPAVLISVDDDISIKESVKKEEIKKFLRKPINPSILYDAISKICDVVISKPIFDVSKVHFNDKNILVVEDNDINLEVATYLLKDTGIDIDIARNGVEAVEKVKENNYDAILMDIQMPIMDGYKATRVIREELKNKTPIIAMTANVMTHDIEECMKVGMNSHIGKPFEVEELYEVLMKTFGMEATYITDKALSVVKISTKSFDKEESIRRLGDNEKLWNRVLEGFYEEYINLEEKIYSFIKEEDTKSLQRYVHSLKGLSGTICASDLANEAKDIEDRIKIDKSFEGISFEKLIELKKDLFKQLKVEYESIKENIKKRRVEDLSKDEIIVKLKDLGEALESSSVSKVKSSLALLNDVESLKNNENYLHIKEDCAHFEYKSAKLFVNTLIKELTNA